MVQLMTFNDLFKIPICYNKEVKKLSDSIITDLELVNTFDGLIDKFLEIYFGKYGRPDTFHESNIKLCNLSES